MMVQSIQILKTKKCLGFKTPDNRLLAVARDGFTRVATPHDLLVQEFIYKEETSLGQLEELIIVMPDSFRMISTLDGKIHGQQIEYDCHSNIIRKAITKYNTNEYEMISLSPEYYITVEGCIKTPSYKTVKYRQGSIHKEFRIIGNEFDFPATDLEKHAEAQKDFDDF